ncbi:unnamed protein product [Brachionus calyciflorus]|uniref:UPAR/Ly6 domain-containing protein n=1 Tax=Brachionus calyciflorus TaxID=104777 RepID=A0A813S042_9BILA|nr:unnamed protein product [Brachionus calyciflorus]
MKFSNNLILLISILGLVKYSLGLKCYTCASCNVFSLANQTTCEPGLDRCATLTVSISGLTTNVGTCFPSIYCNKANLTSIWNQYAANNSISEATLSDVRCCSTDLCNSSFLYKFSNLVGILSLIFYLFSFKTIY